MGSCFDLGGRVVAVTAAHKGLGRVFAKALAAAGAGNCGLAVTPIVPEHRAEAARHLTYYRSSRAACAAM